MQTTPTLVPDHHPTLLDEPLLLQAAHRLDDLERRLVDMSQTMDLLRQGADPGGPDAANASTRLRPEHAMLAEVRAARARLDAGSYGLCAVCDAPIEQHRLAGRPQVRHCGVCEPQQRRL